MPTFSAQPVRRQLFIAILLLLVPVLAAAVWSGVATYRERVEDLREQTRVVALTTAAWVDRDLTGTERVAEALAEASPFRTFDAAAVTDVLHRALTSRASLSDIVLAREDGTVVARGATGSVDLLANNGGWAARTMKAQGRVVEQLAGLPSGTQPVLLAYPVRADDGRVAGALGFVMNLEAIQRAISELPMPEGAVVTITDERNRILARTTEAGRYLGATLPRTSGDVPPDGVSEEREGVDGVRRIYGDAPAPNGPWVISVGIPVSVAVSKTAALWTRSFAILGLGLAGWLIVAFVMSRRLGDSINHLDAAAKRIAAGDFSPLERKPMLSREFAQLQAAFDSMLQRFNETRKALDAQMAEERRIRQELESLQGQVIRQERLAAVGQLVSGVAHEINNPLQAILGFAELLQMQRDVPESVKTDLRLIQKESARACGIIRNLALFARQQPGEAGPIRIGSVITSVAELRQRRLESEDIHLQIEDHSKQHVQAVATELQQVVLNFVVNAEQSIVQSGRLPGRITIRSIDRQSRVILEVEDTGPGVPPEHEAKLFQPFFTTKPVGQGTGLGLSVSYGIVDSLGGQIGYRRAPAGGSIFYFDLPAAAAVAK